MVFGAEPERECPTCGAVSRTARPACPACGKRYDRRAPWLGTRARIAIAVLGLAVLVAGVAIAAPSFRDEKQTEESTAAAEHQRAVDAEVARLVREQRPVRGKAPASVPRDDASAPDAERKRLRAGLVRALETAVLAEARQRVETGEMDGPITRSECQPLMRTPEGLGDDAYPDRLRGRYDCVAVKAEVVRDGKRVAAYGHPFVATINFAKGTWTMCKDNKIPGERGKALAKARIDAACVGAEGAKIIGDGYADPGT